MPNQTSPFVRYEQKPLLLLASVAGLVRAERLFDYAYRQSVVLNKKLEEVSKRRDYLEAEVAYLEFKKLEVRMWEPDRDDDCQEVLRVDRERQVEENKRFLDECNFQELETRNEMDRYRKQKDKAEKGWKAYNSECRQYGHPITISILSKAMKAFYPLII